MEMMDATPAPTKLNPLDFGYSPVPGAPKPPPLEKPPFTLQEIKRAIPSHCFNRSLVRSFAHLFLNLGICITIFYAGLWIPVFPLIIRGCLWPVYWFVQGSYMTGLWVVAHECGHQAFSDYKIVNNTVGFILHSLLLVPYHSWRITHRRHHLNTGSCENDEVFVPVSKNERSDSVWKEIAQESPVYNFIRIMLMLVVGWMPAYLIFNSTGPAKYRGTYANHFNPYAPMFTAKQYNEIILSDAGFITALAGLVYFSRRFTFAAVFFYYCLPYFVTNYHLVLITFLQHTDVFVPHFRSEEWSWLRGALSTVDRSFGKWLDSVFHHISDTHVCHHLFSTMPFYHCQEATEKISAVIGDYRLKDDTPIFKALWRAYTKCKFVEDGNIVFAKSEIKQD